jgi:curved DNA-binding protein CbpA
VNHDPFAQLGLPTRADLSDDDVRAAWRRVAAATHPDRDDGGDPARFGAAAAAYATLRTSYGRGEALADLGGAGGARGARGAGGAGSAARAGDASGVVGAGRVGGASGAGGAGRRGGTGWRGTTGWFGVIAVRAGLTAAVAVLTFLVAGWAPSSIGVLAGLLTWLFVAAGLAVPRRRSR